MHGMCRMNEMKWKKRDEEEKSQRARVVWKERKQNTAAFCMNRVGNDR